MSEQPTKVAIEKAVEWWADKLRSCKNSGLSAAERRNPASGAYQMAEMLMTATKPKVTDEQIETFKSLLASTFKSWPAGAHIWLDVDYHPDRALADALAGAGIENAMGVLPIKTSMWIEGDKVSVRYGYGADEVQL